MNTLYILKFLYYCRGGKRETITQKLIYTTETLSYTSCTFEMHFFSCVYKRGEPTLKARGATYNQNKL